MPVKYLIPHLPMLGKGSIMLDIFDASGNLTGYQHLGNANKVDQEIKDDKDELYQSINAVPTLIATAVKKRQVILTITGTDFSSSHMAIAMMSAGKSTLTVAATPVTGEVIASATAKKKGKYFVLAHINLNAGTLVLTQPTGPTTLVLGTDYIIADALQGIIYFPLTSALDEAQTVVAGYTPTAGTFDQVAGATVPFVQGRLRFAPDPTDGQAIGVEWWKCNLTPQGKVGLIADTYGNWELEAMVLDDTANHPNSPYFLTTFYPSPA
jgi:hypothetical protein